MSPPPPLLKTHKAPAPWNTHRVFEQMQDKESLDKAPFDSFKLALPGASLVGRGGGAFHVIFL